MGLKQKAKATASDFCMVPRAVHWVLRLKKSARGKFYENHATQVLGAAGL